jgi:ribosomal protein S19
LPYLSSSLFRIFSKPSERPNLVWSRSSTFLFPHLGKTFKVYNGKKFVSVQVKKPLLGHYIGDFCMSKMLGRKIHLRKKKKKASSKK